MSFIQLIGYINMSQMRENIESAERTQNISAATEEQLATM